MRLAVDVRTVNTARIKEACPMLDLEAEVNDLRPESASPVWICYRVTCSFKLTLLHTLHVT